MSALLDPGEPAGMLAGAASDHRVHKAIRAIRDLIAADLGLAQRDRALAAFQDPGECDTARRVLQVVREGGNRCGEWTRQ